MGLRLRSPGESTQGRTGSRATFASHRRREETINETLLILHILAAAAWLGAGIYNGFLGPRFVALGGEGAGAFVRVVSKAMTGYFMPAGILTLLTGVGLVLVNDAFGWADLFVSIGLAVVIITTIIGSVVMGPTSRAAVSALDEGDVATAGAAGQKLRNWGLVITLLLIVATVFMVLKTGAG